ncbi:Transmembrane emp24 domain-containing protein p24delta9 [Linum grandiflorum]
MAIHELFFILIFTALATLFHESQSLRFEIQSSHTKCITEDIKANALTVGKYTVINPIDGHPLADHLKLTVRVTSSYGNTFHTAENVESGQFAFTASETGDYMACFYAAGHYPAVTSTVDFEWRTGVAAKDWSSIAKKGSVEGRRDAGPEQIHQHNDGVAWYVLFVSLFIRRRLPVLAPQDLFREEEDHLSYLHKQVFFSFWFHFCNPLLDV